MIRPQFRIDNFTKRFLSSSSSSTIDESSFVFDKGVKHIQRTSAANIVILITFEMKSQAIWWTVLMIFDGKRVSLGTFDI